MAKRVLGIVLSLLGILGLIMAGVTFMNHSVGEHSAKSIAVYAILGAIFFFAGIALVRDTKDVVRNDEHVS